MMKNSLLLLCLISSCTSAPVVGEADQGSGAGAGSPTVITTGFPAGPGYPASDLGAATGRATSTGSVAFHGGAWVIPLPAQTPGTVISEVDATVTGPDNGGGVRVEVMSTSAGSLNFTTPPSVGVPVLAHVAIQRTVVAGEALYLVVSPKDGTGAWASTDTAVSGVQAICPPPSGPTTTDTYSIGFALPGPGVLLSPGAAGTGAALILGTSTASSNLPLHIHTGSTLTGWSARIIKNATGPVTMRLWRTVVGSAAATQVGSTQLTTWGGSVLLGQSGLSEQVITNSSYFIEVVGGGASGDSVMDYQDSWQ